jgi:hypothetical protein
MTMVASEDCGLRQTLVGDVWSVHEALRAENLFRAGSWFPARATADWPSASAWRHWLLSD